MQRKLPGKILLLLTLLPACGDDKGDTGGSTGGSTGNTTPATSAPEGTTAETPTSGDPDTGSTGTPPDPGPPVCQEACGSDADCFKFGVDNGDACVRDRCGPGCSDDTQCVVKFSYWAVDCGGPDNCPNQACVDVGGGQGKCAQVPSDQLSCADLEQSEVMFPLVGGGSALVCANTLYKCDGGLCDSQCTSDAECLTPGLGKCNLANGQCECVDDAGCMAANFSTPKCSPLGFCGCGSDDNCTGSVNTPKCTPEAFCGCETDEQCVAQLLGDTCTEGRCGCSSAGACTGTKLYDGTAFVCESG